MECIYTSEKDVKYLKDLYSKCDKQKMILLVVESIEGYKFGIFIQEFALVEKCDSKYYYSNYNNENFVFRLNDIKIYKPSFSESLFDKVHYGYGHINIKKMEYWLMKNFL